MSFDDDKNQTSASVKEKNSRGIIFALVASIGVAAFFAGLYVSNLSQDSVTEEEMNTAIIRLEEKIDSMKQQVGLPTKPIKISADDDPIRGDVNAPITIIEFSDFQCPFCARFHIQTLPQIMEEYINTGKVKLVYRDFPIQSIHPNALPAALAAECADEQEKYWQYHDILFENQQTWNKLDTTSAIVTFEQYGKDIDLNLEQFQTCLSSGKYLDEIRKDLNDGRDYGISGTPGFYVGNDKIGYVEISGAQPFSAFKNVIDSQLDA